jgi:tetratricopeptide (TPR) repeat protein
VARMSPLYCRYNGFLLGQLLAVAFCDVDGGALEEGGRGDRIREFLREIEIDVAVPLSPGEDAAASHAAVLSAMLPRLAARSRELAEFAILGGLLTHYALLARRDADTAAAILLEIKRLRSVYDLPPIDPLGLAVSAQEGTAERVLTPGLNYLRDVITRMPIEADTAFVIMPWGPADAAGFDGFCRPTLEHCGYRAFRPWAALAGEAYADLMLTLLGRVGMVWADVSTIDHDAAYQIGAAQALGKLGVIVARADRAAVPARIGRDAVVRYDPSAEDWPRSAVLLMSACLAAITLAAERGDRLHVTPSSIEGVFDEVSQALGRILLPPEAREAQRRGRRAMDAGDLLVAEASFDEACRLGLHDEETKLWRGWARLGLGRLAEASADLDAVLGKDPLAAPAGEWRPIAAYLRAVLREAQGDLPGALRDFELAVALGLPDADVRDKRDALAARVGA